MIKEDNRAELLRSELEKLLLTLKRNRENVPLQTLKTTYKKGYLALCDKIRLLASDYLKKLVLCQLLLHTDYKTEGLALIQKAIDRSCLIKPLSLALFKNQDLQEFEMLAQQLRAEVLAELELYYQDHIALYITSQSLIEPYPPPELYCPVNCCILRNGVWIPLAEFRQTEASNNSRSTPNNKQKIT